ncbi:MAG: hypothetical protein ACRC14_10585 [Paracoccaceae bacterium]
MNDANAIKWHTSQRIGMMDARAFPGSCWQPSLLQTARTPRRPTHNDRPHGLVLHRKTPVPYLSLSLPEREKRQDRGTVTSGFFASARPWKFAYNPKMNIVYKGLPLQHQLGGPGRRIPLDFFLLVRISGRALSSNDKQWTALTMMPKFARIADKLSLRLLPERHQFAD